MSWILSFSCILCVFLFRFLRSCPWEFQFHFFKNVELERSFNNLSDCYFVLWS